MQLHFHATLRPIAGGRSVDLPIAEGTTVRELLAVVFARFPAMEPELISPEGELWPHVHVFVNGRDAHYLDGGLDAAVPSGAKVDVFPAVGGG